MHCGVGWKTDPGRSGLDNWVSQALERGSILDSGTTKRENMHRGAHTPRTCSLRSLNMGPQVFCIFCGLKNQSRDLEKWSRGCLLAPGLVPPHSPPSTTPLWGWLLSRVLTPFFNTVFVYFLGCAGSSLLHGLFSSCSKRGLLSRCGVLAFHGCGFSYCRAWTLGHSGFSSCGSWAQELRLPGSRVQA